MNIVVIDNKNVKSKPIDMLMYSKYNISRESDLSNYSTNPAFPYIVLADYQSVVSDNMLIKLSKNTLSNYQFKGLIIYGDVEDNILLPIKTFSKKLGIENVRTLGGKYSYRKLNQSIMNTYNSNLMYFSSMINPYGDHNRINIQSNNIKPYYQPKISCSSKKVIGYEVLGRILVDNKTLTPDLFLQQLIYQQQITQFTYLLIYKALEEITQLRDFCGELSFNVDYTSLDDPSFYQNVISIFKAFSFPLNRVILEISEKNPIYSSNVIENLTNFREENIGISIDDFGMADSGFTQLLNIPFTEIKIDRSYISEMQESSYMLKIVKALAAVANCMEVCIVAEGVENAQQIDILKSINIDILQGFYFSKPNPIEKIYIT